MAADTDQPDNVVVIDKWKPETFGLMIVEDKGFFVEPAAGGKCQFFPKNVSAVHDSQRTNRSVGYRYRRLSDIIIDHFVADQNLQTVRPNLAIN